MIKIKRVAEFRANLKSLTEKRNDKVLDLQAIIEGAKTEVRALNEEEVVKFDTIDKEIKDIDATIKAEERARDLTLNVDTVEKKEELRAEELEERAFANYVRGTVSEIRTATNLDVSTNGAVIPKTIAKKIIETVKELSPIYALATKYNVKGELSFPVYDEATQKITCAYSDEFSPLASASGKFTSVSLTGFLAGALTKVSQSLVNNSDFDLVNYVITKMAAAIAEFLEKELIVGTSTKMTGIISSTKGNTAASATAIVADDLVDLQLEVVEIYQPNAVWIMNKATFKAIRKLKDSNGDYLLNKDATKEFGWELLGKPVYITSNMPTIAASAKAVVYGDMSGLYVKLVQNVEIQVLREKFADEHALGVVGWVEADSKIIEPQKIAVLTMKSA